MIRQISCNIIRAFSIHNKTQNFFDMNPIYPDFGQKNFDIYNSQRKKINVLDQYQRVQRQTFFKRRLVREKLYLPKYDKFKTYQGGRKIKIDQGTNLPIGMDSQFDQFVQIYRRNLYVDQTAKSEFKATLLKLIYRFKCKSETQLIRLFRISIANSKKKDIVQKIRGQMIQEAITKTASMKRRQEVKGDIDQEQAFDLALKELDEKIEKAEEALRYDAKGVPKILSNYDSKYGWMETREEIYQEDYDLDVDVGPTKVIKTSSAPNQLNLQDWSIKNRINRLYFLRRLEFLKRKQGKQFHDLSFYQQLPLNIRDRDKIMNQIAHKYKQSELVQIPDLEEIYREIDVMIDKVYVKVSAGGRPNSESQTSDEIYDRSPEVREFLWNNINAEEILCDTMYSNDSLNNVVLTDEYIKEVSPSAHTELTLTKIPVNLFRHSELQNFAIFNEYRTKLSDNLLRVEEIDFEPQFSEFSLESARKVYRRISQQRIQKGTSAKGQARRKTAYAQAQIKDGTGKVTINGKLLQDYFGDPYYRVQALKPLIITDTSGLLDVKIKAFGSGLHGQSQCMAYALARALMKINPEHKRVLAGFGLVGFDFRKKQPKKTNLYSARVRPPYVRR